MPVNGDTASRDTGGDARPQRWRFPTRAASYRAGRQQLVTAERILILPFRGMTERGNEIGEEPASYGEHEHEEDAETQQCQIAPFG